MLPHTPPFKHIHSCPSLPRLTHFANEGYIGVARGAMGVVMVPSTFFMMNPRISPATVGFAVYGAMGGILGALGGKTF